MNLFNNKAQAEVTVIILFLLLMVVLVVFFLIKDISIQHGASKDIVQGYDKGLLWNHAYLKNDHFTAYCFDDESFIPLLEQSQKQNKEVIVTYEKYIGRGMLCSSADHYENVVITKVEFEQ
jgi:hypothetical protein